MSKSSTSGNCSKCISNHNHSNYSIDSMEKGRLSSDKQTYADTVAA